MFDVLIVGGGPGGISAALYARRSNLKVLVLTKGLSSLHKAEAIENYYGLEAPISGDALFMRGHDQARALGAEIVEAEVLGAEFDGKIYRLRTGGGSYEGRALIFATGLGRVTPKIEGLSAFEGRGVSYCTMCDAFFYRGRPVAVLGDGEYAVHEAETLLAVAQSVTLLTNGAQPPAALPEGLSVRSEPLRCVCGDDRVREIRFASGEPLSVDGLFVAVGVAGTTELARVLGAQLDGSRVVVDDKMHTSIDGLFACGDCTGGLLQVAKAVYEGALAGTEAVKFLRHSAKAAKA